MQRIQYSSDLKVPQAEIGLEELFEFLLDRGAVPDAKGIHMLRVSGLWTPTGTSLMLSPASNQSALRVSMPDDSDGVLSLALQWKQEWNRRNHESLPPGWMRLNFPVKTSRANDEGKTHAEKPAMLGDGASAKDKMDDVEVPNSYMPTPTSLRFKLSSIPSHPYVQITSPRYENNHSPISSAPLPLPTLVHPNTPWLAPLSLSLALSYPSPTTFLTLPSFLHTIAQESSVPCGVLVLLHLLSHNDAPEWETPHPVAEHPLEIHERFMAQNRAKAREMQMPEAERQRAQRARQQEELAAMNMRAMKESRERHEREEKREREAIASQRMGIGVVTKAALSYLVGAGQVVTLDGNEDEGSGEGKDADQIAVEALLVGIYKGILGIGGEEYSWALVVCGMLDRWRDWSERGGMNKEDLRIVLQDKTAFCWAAIAVGLVTRVCEKERADGGGLLGDVRECLRVWKKVRLG
ncbi:MAG: hypothetical protein Q9201_006551 [Fulgogasparrea decipioides]